MSSGAAPLSWPRKLRAVAVIPARLASTRLPRKMLLARTGRPLFAHTADAVARCADVERVLVATDAPEILAAARAAGIEAVLTRADHASGTDRVHEAYQGLRAAGESYDVVLDVQGDEPDVAPGDLAALVGAFADQRVEIATLWAPFAHVEEARGPNAVKVVLDARGDALYFSRAPLPDGSHVRPGAEPAGPKRHVGVYAFRPDALARFCALPRGSLEQTENLEQLRWLEAGGRIRVLAARHVPVGIDTAEDYERFVARVSSSPSPPASTPTSTPRGPG